MGERVFAKSVFRRVLSCAIVVLAALCVFAACSNGNTGTDNHVHDFSMWEIKTEATCIAQGMQVRKCSTCGFEEYSQISTTGHTPVVDAAVKATCTTDGKTEGSHCGVCNTVIVAQTKVAALGHSWENATCMAPKTCSVCGKTEGQLGEHRHQETGRVEATASKDGSVTYTCGVCGDSYQEILFATGSVGLQYERNTNGTYTVVGLGTCTDSHVVIPRYYEGAKVTAIGTRAFYNQTTITEITIPDTISTIGTQIFYKCSALHTVYYNGTYGSADNPFLNVANIKQVVFGGKTVPNYICYNSQNIEEIVILDSVTSICDWAFYNCSSLTNVTIGNSVTSIGNRTFAGCSSLTNVTIGNSVTSIGNYAFSGCRSLKELRFGGTKAQWNAISKGDYWAALTGEYTIYCTDGEISK